MNRGGENDNGEPRPATNRRRIAKCLLSDSVFLLHSAKTFTGRAGADVLSNYKDRRVGPSTAAGGYAPLRRRGSSSSNRCLLIRFSLHAEASFGSMTHHQLPFAGTASTKAPVASQCQYVQPINTPGSCLTMISFRFGGSWCVAEALPSLLAAGREQPVAIDANRKRMNHGNFIGA